MNDQELMDAVVAVKSYCDLIGIDNENIDMVVALAERVLSAGETLPEKRDNPVEFITDDVPPQVAYQWGYNQAIDDCRAVIAAHYVSREEYEKVKADNILMAETIKNFNEDYFVKENTQHLLHIADLEAQLAQGKLTVDELFNIARMQTWFTQSKVPTHDELYSTCEAIVAATDKGI